MKKLLILFCCIASCCLYAQETIEIPIINGNDDAYEEYESDFEPSGTMHLESQLYMGFTEEPYMFYYIGIRYQSVPISPGATIESAFIQFCAYENSEETHSIYTFCEKNPNPPAFTTEEFNISNRETTSKYEIWGVSEWQAWIPNPNSKTHDIKSIVQEIIDMDGWQKNNPLVFIFKGSSPIHGELYPKVACSYEYGAEWYAPMLTITFTDAASVDEQNLFKALNIFPNPVSDKFNIFLKDVQEGEYNICLFDLQGREVTEIFNGHLTSGDQHFALSANELNLQQGIYILSISDLKTEVSRKIIVR